jgi:ABC-type lipoprotein export system ATPase subunit
MPELRLEGISSGLQAPWSLMLASSETVTLSGPSGSGKSRLLRAIIDLDPDTSGDAWIDDMQRSLTPAFEWRRMAGYLPAVSHWWEDHVSAHFPSCTSVELASLGLNASLFESPVSHLSSGEKQRLAIIRLLANQPRVLLLDEPTANLDAQHTLVVEKLISEYQQAHATPVIWVTHDKSQQQRVGDRHFEINDGEILLAATRQEEN